MEQNKSQIEVATLAGGCFWGMEDLIRKIPGVLQVDVGYTGGETANAVYDQVKKGHTGHAEAVQIQFDPSQLSYENLLVHFFKMHDPTTKNQQGNDLGSQYRSAIFFHSPQQKETALKMIQRVDQSNAWGGPVVTEVVPAAAWWKAEEFHQDYLEKNPGGYTCHFVRKVSF